MNFLSALKIKGLGKKRGGSGLGPEKDHETVQIGVLDDSGEKTIRNCCFKNFHFLFSVGTVINFRVEDSLASFWYAFFL